MKKLIEDEGLHLAYLLGKSDGIKQGRAEAIDEFCKGYKNFQTDENICDLQEDCSVSGGWCIDCYKEHWLKEKNR